jgi:hypothetical protein
VNLIYKSMKINRYNQFINEEFFKKIFNNSKKKNKTTKLSRVDSCVVNILDFLSENDVYNWNQFLKMSQFDRGVIDKLIDSEVNNMDELREVRFRLKLELGDRKQLMEYKDELESEEEYEKCALIVKKLSQK